MKKRLLSILLMMVMVTGIFPVLPDSVLTAHALYTPTSKIEAANTSFRLLNDSKEYTVSDLKGKVSIFVLGTLDCPASRIVLSTLNTLAPSLTNEVEMFFIVRDTEDNYKKTKIPATYPNIKMGIDTYKYSSMGTHLGILQKYSVILTPVFVIIDKEGNYYRFSTGGNNTNTTTIQQALEEMNDSSLFKENSFVVTFLDHNDKVLEKVTVKRGQAAKPTVVPSREGYVFTGWSKEINRISSDTTVSALYKKAGEEDVKISDGTLTIDQIVNMAKKYPHNAFNLYKVATFDTAPSYKAPYKAGALKQSAIDDALNVLKMVRFLAGVPFEDVSFTSNLNNIAQHGAVLLAATDQFSHTPTKPNGMDEDFYNKAYRGSREANINTTTNISTGVLSFVHDIGADNLGSAGHRRWVLNPKAKSFGIGFAQNGKIPRTNMHVMSAGVGEPDNYVAWPNAGDFPLQYFYASESLTSVPSIPWSINLGKPYQTPDKNTLTITMRRTRDNKTWFFDKNTENLAGLPLHLNTGMHLAVDNDTVGMQKAITFRPDLISLGSIKPGDTFEIVVSGIKKTNGDPVSFGYRVKFFDLKQAMYEKTGSESSDGKATGNTGTGSTSTNTNSNANNNSKTNTTNNANTGSKTTGNSGTADTNSGSKTTGNSESTKDKSNGPVITISKQPTAVTNVVQGSISKGLSVTASVSSGKPLKYQWAVSKSADMPPVGTKISGATYRNFSIPTNLKAGTYYYFCIVTAEGSKEQRSNIAKVVVGNPIKTTKEPVITIDRQPEAVTTVVQGDIWDSLSVMASVTEGKKPSYQWAVSKDGSTSMGTKIEGATSRFFKIPQNLKPGTYYYFCVVSADGAKDKRTNIAKVIVTK